MKAKSIYDKFIKSNSVRTSWVRQGPPMSFLQRPKTVLVTSVPNSMLKHPVKRKTLKRKTEINVRELVSEREGRT